jgi:IS1 family transposase
MLLYNSGIRDIVNVLGVNAKTQVFREENHPIGKPFTKHIEGVNTSLRARNRLLVRKTTCFSKE